MDDQEQAIAKVTNKQLLAIADEIALNRKNGFNQRFFEPEATWIENCLRTSNRAQAAVEPAQGEQGNLATGERENLETDPTYFESARLCASETACYKWPEDTAEHRALRSAFMDGAASVDGAALPAASEGLPAIPDDDADFTPDLARKIIWKYQTIIGDLRRRLNESDAQPTTPHVLQPEDKR